MEIIYKAFDGKIFYDEDDCQHYEEEKKLEKYQDGIKILDSDGNIMPLALENLERAFYLSIKKEECVDFLFEQDIIYPREKGIYYYDDHCGYVGEWKKIDDKISQLKEKLRFFASVKEKLEG